jgi:hemoglobin
MKPDITDRVAIQQLVYAFYEKLLEDRQLKDFFLKTASIELSSHLPIICDFWESVLFQAGKYKRDMLDKHLELHQLKSLQKEHFDQWLKLFNETVDDLFEGEKAKQAKDRALSLATIIKMKIDHLEKLRLEFGN